LDDNSSDESRKVINQYKENPLISKIIFSETNSGNPFVQWQRGIELAKGEWIWFAESDDYADLHFLRKLIDAVGDKENVGLVYCDSRVVNGSYEGGNFGTLKNNRFKTDRWNYGYLNIGVDEIENYLLPGGTINNSSAVLFRKKLLVSENPFDLKLRYIGDKYAFIKVLAKSDVLYLPECLNYYRDPFNTKHVDKFLFYFYEQFLVFDWVFKNITLTNRSEFFKGFYSNTRNSLFRGWNRTKVNLYFKLFSLNSDLLLRSIFYNLIYSISSVFRDKN
jgi:hypothetical protein